MSNGTAINVRSITGYRAIKSGLSSSQKFALESLGRHGELLVVLIELLYNGSSHSNYGRKRRSANRDSNLDYLCRVLDAVADIEWGWEKQIGNSWKLSIVSPFGDIVFYSKERFAGPDFEGKNVKKGLSSQRLSLWIGSYIRDQAK
jgi:hypothetical protein